jgi:hypothetical protein
MSRRSVVGFFFSRLGNFLMDILLQLPMLHGRAIPMPEQAETMRCKVLSEKTKQRFPTTHGDACFVLARRSRLGKHRKFPTS